MNFSFFISLFLLKSVYGQYFFDTMKNQTSNIQYFLGLIKGRSKVCEKIMYCEWPLNTD